MDLLDDDMGIWVLIFYYTLSGLLRTDIEFSMIFLLIGYNIFVSEQKVRLHSYTRREVVWGYPKPLRSVYTVLGEDLESQNSPTSVYN
jgi:hypothetical protein